MRNLVRTASGGFTSEVAIPITEFEAAANSSHWQDYLIPPTAALTDLTTVELSEENLEAIVRGRKIPAVAITTELAKVCTHDGQVVAILKPSADKNHFQPIKVFIDSNSIFQ